MALTRKLNGKILHITEIIHSFRGTKTQHWYYDLKLWMVSSHGREGDTPDRKMTARAIEWTTKHHFPAVGLKPTNTF
jgi:hypothetical protein